MSSTAPRSTVSDRGTSGQGVRPSQADLRRHREHCYRARCREFFGDTQTVVIDVARNGRPVAVKATCHGADFAGADVWWWFHLATGADL